ncbi:MAG: ThuA domain-containing protein [Gemmatimonadota bacterium]|nr:ThuA domain-containing protein [Gemmatimonadota bacterium]
MKPPPAAFAASPMVASPQMRRKKGQTMKPLVVVAIAALALGALGVRTGLETLDAQSTAVSWSKVRLLVYTKNGTGYVHDNIPASIEAIKALAAEHKFAVDASDDPAVFTDANLQKYSALVFSNTNNVVFDTDAQRVALMRYVQAGGGFVAIHSASGTERTWKWFAGLVGGTFSRHAPFQKFGVLILDRTHPSLAHLPERWEREDECYYLVRRNVNMRVLAVNDLTSIQDSKETPATFGDVFPSVWYQEYDGGRQWYTSLGHRKDDYAHPDFRQHMLGGIRSVVRLAPLDYTRAYAVSPADEPRRR